MITKTEKDFIQIIIFIGIFINLLFLMGCAIPKEKHFYLEYGQKGYLHSPTIRRDEWLTIEIEAPEYKEVREQEVNELLHDVWGID